MANLFQAWDNEAKTLGAAKATPEQIEARRQEVAKYVQAKAKEAGLSSKQTNNILSEFDTYSRRNSASTDDQMTPEERDMVKRTKEGTVGTGALLEAGRAIVDFGRGIGSSIPRVAADLSQAWSDVGDNDPTELSARIARKAYDASEDIQSGYSEGTKRRKQDFWTPTGVAMGVGENLGQIAVTAAGFAATGGAAAAAGLSKAAQLGTAATTGGALAYGQGYGQGKENALDEINKTSNKDLYANVIAEHTAWQQEGGKGEQPYLVKVYQEAEGDLNKMKDLMAEHAGDYSGAFTAVTSPLAMGVGSMMTKKLAQEAAKEGSRSLIAQNILRQTSAADVAELSKRIAANAGVAPQLAKVMGKQAAFQGAEEFLQEGGEGYFASKQGAQARGDKGNLNQQDWDSVLNQGAQGAAIGAIMGGGGSLLLARGHQGVEAQPTAPLNTDALVSAINNAVAPLNQARDTLAGQVEQLAAQVQAIDSATGELGAADIARKQALLQELAAKQTELSAVQTQAQDAAISASNDALKQYAQAGEVPDFNAMGERLGINPDDLSSLYDQHSTSIKQQQAATDTRNKVASLIEANDTEGAQAFLEQNGFKQDQADVIMGDAMKSIAAKNKEANAKKAAEAKQQAKLDAETKLRAERDSELATILKTKPDASFANDVLPILQKKYKLQSGSEALSVWNEAKKQSKTAPVEQQADAAEVTDEERLNAKKALYSLYKNKGHPDDVVASHVMGEQERANKDGAPRNIWESVSGAIGSSPASQKSPFKDGKLITTIHPEGKATADEQTPAIDNTQAIADELAQHVETKTRPDFIGLGKKYGVKPLALDAQYREMLRVKKEQSKTVPPVAPSPNEAAPIVQPTPKQKAADRPIDPEKDSLLVALAKLGGLSRDEAISHGVDKAMLGHRPIFGKLLFRTDGKPFDQAATDLSQDNYPVFEGNDYNDTGLHGGNDRKSTGKALLASLMDALNGNDVGTPQYYVAKVQKAYDEEQEQARIDALFEGKGNSKADWLDDVSDAIVDELIENPSTATQEVIEVIQNDAGTEAQDVTGNSQAETQPTADETSPPVSSQETTSQSESGGREGAGSSQTNTKSIADDYKDFPVVAFHPTYGEIIEVPTIRGGNVRISRAEAERNISPTVNTFTKDGKLKEEKHVLGNTLIGDKPLTDTAQQTKDMKEAGWTVAQKPSTRIQEFKLMQEGYSSYVPDGKGGFQEVGNDGFVWAKPPQKTTNGQQIAEALDATATAIGAAAHQSAINRFKKEGGLTYTKPEAIAQVQKDERYNIEINANGHAVVKGIKDGDTWVGVAPEAQTERKEAQEIGDAEFDARMKELGYQEQEEIIDHVTAKGKTIRGVVRKGITKDEAKQIDPYTFAKDGGFFLREKYLTKADTVKAEIKQPETKALPPQDRLVGKNSEGKDLYEDSRGVRYFKQSGAKVYEGIAIGRNNSLGAIQREDEYRTVEEVAARQPNPQPKEETPTPKQQSVNTIFTEDAAAAARARLKKKLGGNNLFSGFDPEILQDGLILAGFHIEKGARSFAAFAKAIVEDMGDSVKPYIKSWYMGVKFDPRAANFDGMTGAAEVEGADIESILKEGSPKTTAPTATKDTLTDLFYDHLKKGTLPKDNVALRKMVSEFDGKEVDNYRLKAAQEELEAAMASYARDVVAAGNNDAATFNQLLDTYQNQPNLNIRTSTSVENQAYSTPAPLAFMAARLAGIDRTTAVYEPTAGNGMLLLTAKPSNAIANELEDTRFANLKGQGFKTHQGDAVQAIANGVVKENSQDAIITNPPFGSIKDKDGNPTKVQADGYKLGKIDHLIAAEALRAMKDKGRATLIIGADKVAGGVSTDDRIFFNWLYSHYNVTGHFELDGKLYNRQGAGWPVRVITIDGRKESNNVSPQVGTIQRYNTWEKVYEQYQLLAAANSGRESASSTSGTDLTQRNEQSATSKPNDTQGASTRSPSGGRSTTDTRGVSGQSTRNVSNRNGAKPDELRGSDNVQRLDERTNAQDNLAIGDNRDTAKTAEPNQGRTGRTDATKPDGSILVDTDNAFQVKYTPHSSRKDEGVLVPINMKQPMADALSILEDRVGDVDKYAAKELGYKSVDELHDALMGLQVDSVASAIYQMSEKNKGVIIADQTGIGKGRQAAAIIRWAKNKGLTPVFVTVKPSLFTDMYGDLADIGSNDISPFIMNLDASISSADGKKLFGNKSATHKNNILNTIATGELPEGSNAVFLTYSQINTANNQRRFLSTIAPRSIFILDESHNAGGSSSTGLFVRNLLKEVQGVVYLSATFAKRPDNMPLYFKTDMGESVSDTGQLSTIMAQGGLPLQTIVSNALVKAGQMFRRERSYNGVSIVTKVDSANKAKHEKLSDKTTTALRAITHADSLFHTHYFSQLEKEMEARGESLGEAGNNASESVNHTEFSSVVHNFIRQMLLGLKADTAANEAITALKNGEKPLIALENTMGSFLNEYADANSLSDGDSLGDFGYRNVLSRALERSRYIIHKNAQGEEERMFIQLSELDPKTRAAYDQAQKIIDKLDIDIPVSPLDWIRHRIQDAGYSVAEITGRDMAVDYSTKTPTLTKVPLIEQNDKVNTTRMFNDGRLDAVILNVSGSTGISLHASEKFKDQRQRHMIVAQPAQDINIFMQMLGRIHRTGQVVLPKYTILNVDLAAEKRPTALLNKKMKSLNANTSSNTESATSIKSVDMLNKYGDQVINAFLRENPDIAVALRIGFGEDDAVAEADIARKATGRMALLPVSKQMEIYNEVEEQYNSLISYLDETGQNDLEPRTIDYAAEMVKESVMVEATDAKTPFGQEAVYGEYKVKAQGKPMTFDQMKELATKNLDGHTNGKAHAKSFIEQQQKAFPQMNADTTLLIGDELDAATSAMASFNQSAEYINSHYIGSAWTIDIKGDIYNAVVTNIRTTHKGKGNPLSASKIQFTLAVNGALRSITIPATEFKRIEVGPTRGDLRQIFAPRANDQDIVKIITGNLLAGYANLVGMNGSIISFTKKDGSIEQGILLPKKFDFKENARHDFQLKTARDAVAVLDGVTDSDFSRFGIASRIGDIRITRQGDNLKIVVPKSKATGGKWFLDKELTAIVGDFVSNGNMMQVIVKGRDKEKALAVVLKKSPLYVLPSMAEEAKEIVTKNAPKFSRESPKNDNGIPIYRIDNKDFDANKIKPHGLYVSIPNDTATFDSPHKDVGDTAFAGYASPKNPLNVESVKIQHKRGNNYPIETSAGVSALRQLVDKPLFDSLIKTNKAELTATIKEQFPDVDTSQYHDAYELLEVLGAQLAIQDGHDAIVLKNGDDQFNEMVILDNSIIDSMDALKSKGDKGAGLTTTQVRNTLVEHFGEKTVKELEDKGLVVIHANVSSVPKEFDAKKGDQGVYDPNTGITHLIAENLNPKTVLPTMLHEMGGHVGFQTMLEPKLYDALMGTFNRLVEAGNPIAIEAKKRAEVEQNKSTQEMEYLPYLLTVAQQELQATNLQKSAITKLIDRIISAVRAFAFEKLGIRLELTPNDIVALGERMIKTIAKAKVETTKGSDAQLQFSKQDKIWRDFNIVKDLLDKMGMKYEEVESKQSDSMYLYVSSKKGGLTKIRFSDHPLPEKHAITHGESELQVGVYNEGDTLYGAMQELSIITGKELPTDFISKQESLLAANQKRRDTLATKKAINFLNENPEFKKVVEDLYKKKGDKAALSIQGAAGLNGRAFSNKAKKIGYENILNAVKPNVLFSREIINRTDPNTGRTDSTDIRINEPNQPSPTNPKLNRLLHGIAPGEKLFNALAKPIHKWIDAHTSSQWKLVNNMPSAFKQMMREYLRDQKASEEQTKNIVENGLAMSSDERILLSDVLEKMLADGTTVPEHIVQVAAAMRSALSGQTDELVRLGMLSEGSAERWRDTYLPRLYDKAAKDPINKALAKRLNIVGDHLKGRGIFREVEENLESKYEKLGWENRGKGKKGHVIMWRDYTPEERAKMGEVRDALQRFAMGFLSTQRDIATGRLLEKIADNPDLASVTPVAGWVLVPTATIKETGGVKRYGKLSGMYVHPDVWENTKHYIDDRDGLMEFYRQTLSVWKQGKTALNLVAHMNNVVSNAVMVTAAGANMADVARGYDSIIKEDQYYKEAKELGMLASGHFTGDIRDYFGGDIQDATTPSNLVFKAFKAAWRNKGFEFMRKMYDAEDQLFRMALYRKARELGATQAESIDFAETFMFNYADLPAGIKKIRDFGLPFISYTYKAVPAVTRVALTHPHRVLALVGMVYAFNAIAYAMLGADADEDKERKNLPDYMQGYSAWGVPKLVRLPWNDGEKAAFLDIYRWMPLGDFFAIGNRTGGADMPTWAMMSGPYWSFYNTMIQNRNGLTGKNYLEDTDTDRQVFFKRMKFGLSEWVPMYYHLDKNLNAVRNELGDTPASKLLEGMGYTGTDMRGDPSELKNSLLGATGIKVRKLDMDDQQQRKLVALKSEMLDRVRQMRRIQRDKSNPYRERDIAAQKEEIKRLKEKAQEIRKQ